MKKLRYVLLLATAGFSIASSTTAAQVPLTADRMLAELPLIPLERSLVPWSQTTDLEASPPDVTVAEVSTHRTPHTLANALVRGLLVANRTGEISYHAPLRYRVQDVVRSLRRGNDLESSRVRARVPQATVIRLLSLGNGATSQMQWSRVPLLERLMASHSLANAIVRGLLVANRTGEIAYAAPLSYRVQNIVRGLRRGEPLMLASTRAKVPQPVVNHLLQLGNYDQVQIN